jgi:hypothetical protein
MSPAMDVQQMIEQLDQFQLPGSLMESFDAYRQDCVKAVTDGFSHSQLAWFLDLMNRFRGPDDRKDSLLDVFDPCMFTTEHPAWDSEPGTSIDMPALTSEVAALAANDEEFTHRARLELASFREHADAYDDSELLGLARIARASLVDRKQAFHGRHDAIKYLALNASVQLEDLWALDDTLWTKAPMRHIEFDDMVAKRKVDLMATSVAPVQFRETDFACYTEDEFRAFAFDMRSFFLMNRTKHLTICSRCQNRLKYWANLVDKFDQAAISKRGMADA